MIACAFKQGLDEIEAWKSRDKKRNRIMRIWKRTTVIPTEYGAKPETELHFQVSTPLDDHCKMMPTIALARY